MFLLTFSSAVPESGTRGASRPAFAQSAPGRSRTYGQRFRKPLLYPLSYGGRRGLPASEDDSTKRLSGQRDQPIEAHAALTSAKGRGWRRLTSKALGPTENIRNEFALSTKLRYNRLIRQTCPLTFEASVGVRRFARSPNLTFAKGRGMASAHVIFDVRQGPGDGVGSRHF